MRIHAARLRPAPNELIGRQEVWAELVRRGVTIATVTFAGRGGAGGHTDRIALLAPDGDGLCELELWTSRDELCLALEAPVWARFGSFAGYPQVRGEVIWLAEHRVVNIVATRGEHAFEERVH